MKKINEKTRNMHKLFEMNPGMCVQYWGNVRSWKEGCRVCAESIIEAMLINDDPGRLMYLIGRLKWLWDREHFLDPENTKTLESFYIATTKEVSKRMTEISENLPI